MSCRISALSCTTFSISASGRFGWKASSGGTSAPVNLPAKAMAAAASGWKTRAACSFLQSLELWGLDGASDGKVSASTTRWSTSVRSWSLSLLCTKSDKLVSAWSAGHNGASANIPISTACLSLKSLSDLDETSPLADAASASDFPSRTQVMPFPVMNSSQLPVGWSMLTRCLVFLIGRTFLPQTHIFSLVGSHCVAQSVKHSGHWCVAIGSGWVFSLRLSLPTPGRERPATCGCFMTSSWTFCAFIAT